jgi:predicted Zn-dependent protease
MPSSADYKLKFEKANQLRTAGDADGAMRILRGVIAEFPKKPAVYLVIGDILWDTGRLSAASKAFKVATKRFPKLEIASHGLFHTLWQQAKADAAFEEMKRFQAVSHSRDYEKIVNAILGDE